MNIGETASSIIKITVVSACVYAVVKWQFIEPQLDEIGSFAERACVDRMVGRYNADSANVYSVKKNENGYVVRASLTLAKGTTAKVYCLANKHGGVEELILEE
jgi:hypothetical protein